MKTVKVTLQSVTPYYQSQPMDPRDPKMAKLERETSADYEERIWRRKMHVVDSGPAAGKVFIPAGAFKNCLSEAAKYLSMPVPGKGKSTYTRFFETGILVPQDLIIDVMAADVEPHRLFLPADGKRGSGKRVWKNIPRIMEWSGDVTFLVIEDAITPDVFSKHIQEAGKFIGVGTFRPRNNGTFGRFDVKRIIWDGKEVKI